MILWCSDDLIRQADLAMHEVKVNGGNGAQAYNLDMYQRVQQRVLLEQDLKEALLLNAVQYQLSAANDHSDRELCMALKR